MSSYPDGSSALDDSPIITDPSCMCLSLLIISILVAVKQVLSKREADFKAYYHIKQFSLREYEETTKQTTAMEVEKLMNSKEYLQMFAMKGES